MALTSLSIHSLRNITNIDLCPSPGANILWGANGSGKTSILEAIYFLGMGRSFRANRLSQIIQFNKDSCLVSGSLPNNLGVSRARSGVTSIRYAGEKVKSIAELAEIFPLQLLSQADYQLLRQPPQARRAMLDWGVFHVEQSYFESWKAYNKVLKQRNALLRQETVTAQLDVWSNKICALADILTLKRESFCKAWFNKTETLMEQFSFLQKVRLVYKPGWDKEKNLRNILENALKQDKMLGYTRYGAHKADILAYIGGVPAVQILSLGQQKILSILLKIAQSVLVEEFTDKEIIHLVDDLPADLDRYSRQKMLEIILTNTSSSFLACVELEAYDFKENLDSIKMFHVEHGTIKK